MDYLPIFLELRGRKCVVIGGGIIAERKVRALLKCNADVTVVSPEITDTLRTLAVDGTIRHVVRRYRTGDLAGFLLAFDTAGDAAVSSAIADEANSRGVLLNVADAPALCSFIAPAVLSRGTLTVAVSTAGSSPAVAAAVRDEINAFFGPELELWLEIMAAARLSLRRRILDFAERARRLKALARSDLRAAIAKSDLDRADALLREHLDAGFAELGMDPTAIREPAAIAPGTAAGR